MIPVNLKEWIQHPEMLNRDTLYELRNLLAKYPYFQSLRLLYLKNLYVLHDISFGAELRKAVLYIADRRQLFYLIEGGHFTVHAKKTEIPSLSGLKEEPTIDRTLALIDAFLSTAPQEVTSQTNLDYSMDYTSYLWDDKLRADESTEASPKLRGQNLIDEFIEKSENDSPLSLKSLPKEIENAADLQEAIAKTEDGAIIETEQKQSVEKNIEVRGAGVEDEDDSCFTETLAKIYVKQRRYAKALEIIKKLNLKYPKKNAYFADQIRFLEKLIINANSK